MPYSLSGTGFEKTSFRMMVYFLFAFSVFFMSISWAGVDVFAWQPSPTHPIFLIPQKSSESRDEAILKTLPALARKSQEGLLQDLPRGQDKILFIANKETDHHAGHTRATKFMRQFPSSENLLLPLMATDRLTKKERFQLYQTIEKEFSGLVSMGGDDIAPSVYKEPVTYAVNFNEDRDKLEIELIQSWVKAGRGFLYGVCRGHQITSVALGYKMFQDIPIELKSKFPHQDNDHAIHQIKTSHRLLEKMVGFKTPFDVYSWHHQAVKYIPNGFLEVAAKSPDGVVEALEFKNGKGLLTQFHPELMDSTEGKIIIQGIWKNVRAHVAQFSCRRVLLD